MIETLYLVAATPHFPLQKVYACFCIEQNFNFLNIFYWFVQRGRERDRELETSIRENHRSAASCTPPTGDVPAAKVHALDQNQTWDLSVRRPMLYPLSQTRSGPILFKKIYILLIFLQRGRERDRELETSMRENHRSAASCTPPTGDVPATKVHSLDQNWT